ncbi:GDSL-type esterase/lipase family protein [Sphingomonas sp. Tas61C01]|uniref:GDSL-type esterase/lipase family protein n=1 Tax=Sphingomonas sp. Tas61C01 TaxID=3458297 RepID=UPI00403EAD8E
MRTAALLLALSVTAAAPAATVTPATAGVGSAKRLPLHVGGRVVASAEGLKRQWPGSYFEASFRGREALMKLGAGDVTLHVLVDGRLVTTLVKPKPGLYRIGDLAAGAHRLRVEVASESQAAPTVFGGFFATAALPTPARVRQIEFVGDSHTVGYGDVSAKSDCTDAEVWASTDTSKGIAGITGRRYDADYRVNAISGRGVVRNYDGFAADKLPEAYPHILFDKADRAEDRHWRPQLYVVALGTNDFTTLLHAGEKWASRDALHADFETTYAAFLRRLRAHSPAAHILVWATDMADGEIAAEAKRTVDRLRGEGMANIAFTPIAGLALSGCHAHPSVADDERIAQTVATYVDAHPGLWRRGK